MKIELFNTFEEAEEQMIYYTDIFAGNISIYSQYVIYNDKFGIELPENFKDEICSGDVLSLDISFDEREAITNAGASHFASVLEDRYDNGIETPYPTPF